MSIPSPRYGRDAARAAALCLLLAATGCARLPDGDGAQATQSLDLRLADATLAAGAPSAALHVTQDMLARNGQDFPALLRQGRALQALGRFAEAAATFDRAVALHPASLEALTGLARARTAEGDAMQAEIAWRRALRVAPADDRAQTGLAVALDLQERHAAAQALYRAVLDRQPDEQAVRSDLGLSLTLSGEANQGLPMLQQAASGNDDSSAQSARMRHNLAVGLVLAGEDGSARALLSRDLTPEAVDAALAGLHQLAAAQ